MTEEAVAPAAGPTPRDKAITKGYTEATKLLREAHLEEFNTLRVQTTKALGFDWTPPLTAKDKAKAELDKILAEFPDLLEQTVDEDQQDEDVDPVNPPVTAEG